MRSAAARRDRRTTLLPVSALTGEGIDGLRAGDPAGAHGAWSRRRGFITSLRHEQLLRESCEYLEQARARRAKRASRTRCCCWISMRALRPIDAITGATTADDILNRIFSTFCIGK